MNTEAINEKLYQAVAEVLEKDYERYDLVEGDFVELNDRLIRSLVDEIKDKTHEGLLDDNYSKWRDELLASFYARHNYSSYYRKQLRKGKIYMLAKNLSRNIVGYLYSNNKEHTIDVELQMPASHTFAFKLSGKLFAEIYPSLVSDTEIVPTPLHIEDRCRTNMVALFPLQHTHLIERIEKQDREFWNELNMLVSRLVDKMLKKSRSNISSVEYRDEISNEVLGAYHQHAQAGKLKELNSAEHLYYSLRQFCDKRIRAFFRNMNERKEDTFDENVWAQMMDEECDPPSSSHSFPSLDGECPLIADESFTGDLRFTVLRVLYAGKGELYDVLAKGIERSVEVLIMHSIHGVSYEDIALKVYGENSISAYVNLRKMVSRTPDMLCRRMEKIAKKYRKENKLKS